MPRRGALVTLTLALAVALTAWWLAASDGREGPVAPLAGEAPVAEGEVVLPAVGGGEPVALVAQTADRMRPTGSLSITVQHAHGAPAAGARVGLYTPDLRRLLAEGVLDEHGAWSHAGFDEPSRLRVVGVTPSAVNFELEATRGEHTFTLPEGLVIRGQVLLDGAPPMAPFPLRLSARPRDASKRTDPDVEIPPLPLARGPGLGQTVGDGRHGGFYTDAAGAFTVSGIRDVEWFWLRYPSSWWLDNPGKQRDAVWRSDVGEVLLNLRRRGTKFCGRVVDTAGTPVPGARVEVRHRHEIRSWWFDDDLGEWSNDPDPYMKDPTIGRADEDGRFCFHAWVGDASTYLPIPSLELDPIRDIHDLFIWVEAPGEQRALHGLHRPDPDVEHDLGEIVVRPSPAIALRVLDDRGVALEGASVRADHAQELLAIVRHTDPNGEVRLEPLEMALGTATVTAPGFDTARVPIFESPSDRPISVRLRRSTELTVEVRWPAHWAEERLWWYVALSGAPPIFADGLLTPASHVPSELAGGPSVLRTWLDLDAEFDAELLPGGVFFERSDSEPLVLEGLRPHHPIQPRLYVEFDADFHLLDAPRLVWTGDPLWLEPGEQRVLVIDLQGLQLER